MKDFFISYTSADKSWAEWIAWELEHAGFSTVIQAWDFRPGSNFVSEMKGALEQCQRTIAVYSPNYFSSGFAEAEWTAAFAEKALLPVRVRECEIPKLLKPSVYIDLVNRTEQAARRELVQGLNSKRIKPVERPEFPPEANQPKRFPGTLPSIWNVPLARNPNFTGRDDMLRQLHDSLTSGRTAAITQAIAGLGGVGKTQLALEYAYRYASDYKLVWWLSSEQPAALASDYARLALKLDLPEKDAADQPAIIEAVRDWLTQNAGWLLIFDNVPGPTDCEPYRPPANTGHILITSRNPAWRGVAEPLLVQKLSREESIAFLQKRTGNDEHEAADALSEAVGDLPLALEHAGAYMDKTGRTITGYLDLFRARPTDLLGPVAVTWQISFEELDQENADALAVLNVLGFLAPDDIPRALLEIMGMDPIQFDECIGSLRRLSMITTGENSISVHRLVQQVTRDRLDDESRAMYAEAAVKLVNHGFPSSSDYRNWPACSKLLPHVIATATYAESLGVGLETVARLLNQAGLYEQERGQYARAEELLRRALRILENVCGPDHIKVATYANNLGQILHEKGDLDGASEYIERALVIAENSSEPDLPKIAIRANNLGQVLQAKGDLDGALRQTYRALGIWMSLYGANHPDVALATNNLAQILWMKGDPQGALDCAHRALNIDEEVYGPDHPAVARDAGNLGQLLHSMGALEEAVKLTRRAVQILESTYGPDNPTTSLFAENQRRIEAGLAERQQYG